MEPDILRLGAGMQLSFVLPHCLNDVCVYPQKSKNGSHIITYAHDRGLRVVWYAGRRLKKQPSPRINGDSVDLTEDEDHTIAPDYEDDEAEIDPMRPFHDVLTYIDIDLGSSATKIAVPPLSTGQGDDLHKTINAQAVILAACADMSLRLVLFPLEPPLDKEHRTQQIVIDGPNSHQDLISAVAVTVVPALNETEEVRQGGIRSRSRGREESDGRSGVEDIKDWSLLLASTSPTGTGLLLIHQIPYNSDGKVSETSEDLVPIQRRALKCSLARCTLEFNPSLYPSTRHANLLIASSDGAVAKIYQAVPQASRIKKRRGSTATIDSTMSNSQAPKKMLNEKVLIDLLPPFSHTAEEDLLPSRKRVLDAKWILHGRAVLVLLDDGEWGIWDIEAAGPAGLTAASNLVKGQGNISGVQGGSLTKFALKGTVNLGHVPKKSSSSTSTKDTDSSLAPMTPHTRKTRAQGLFKGQAQNSTNESGTPARSAFGSIAVSVQTGNNAGVKVQDESVVFNFGSNNIFIPSIQAHWRSQGVRQGPFDGSANTKPVVLPQLQTAGEEQRNVWLMPRDVNQTRDLSTVSTPDILVATPSRLILFVNPLLESSIQTQTSKLPLHSQDDFPTNQDQLLLNSGELDVDGMDRILDNMGQSKSFIAPQSTLPFEGVARKSVGFRLNDEADEDMDMGTPTTSKGSRNQLFIDRRSNGGNGRRTLFT